MKVICAPDSFKESISAREAAEAMARGVEQACPDAGIELCPISDGGEGFVDAMVAAMSGHVQATQIAGPMPGQVVDAGFGVIARGEVNDVNEATEVNLKVSVVEMASAAGLALVPPEQRDPMAASTFGFGQLLEASVKQADRLLIGIGGSATTDGGAGMAQSLGVGFFDTHGNLIIDPLSGGSLCSIGRIDIEQRNIWFETHSVTVACDVTNPLTGLNGAAHVYGPQKGASPDQVERLNEGLEHLAMLVREQLDVDCANMPGAGAAGGLGFGLVAFLGAALNPGIEMVLDALQFSERLRDADLVLTGEGKLDGQSLQGKACMGVVKRAKVKGIPTVALVGAVGNDVDQAIDAGLDAYHVIGEGLPREVSIARGVELLEMAAARVCRERFDLTH